MGIRRLYLWKKWKSLCISCFWPVKVWWIPLLLVHNFKKVSLLLSLSDKLDIGHGEGYYYSKRFDVIVFPAA
jgi:hypothetical protein